MASNDLYAALTSVTQQGQPGATGFMQNLLNAGTSARSRRSALMEQTLASMSARGLSPTGGSSGGGGGGGYSPSGNPRGQGLTTILAPNGQRVTVAGNYASKFQGLLQDLWNAGYHFKSVGGYNYRNIAGTNTLSKHATGEAIDIDPGANPVSYGGMKTYFDINRIMPIIKKYGLDWGGLWSGKKDPMHFSTGG